MPQIHGSVKGPPYFGKAKKHLHLSFLLVMTVVLVVPVVVVVTVFKVVKILLIGTIVFGVTVATVVKN